jgi:hypothetical protein
MNYNLDFLRKLPVYPFVFYLRLLKFYHAWNYNFLTYIYFIFADNFLTCVSKKNVFVFNSVFNCMFARRVYFYVVVNLLHKPEK